MRFKEILVTVLVLEQSPKERSVAGRSCQVGEEEESEDGERPGGEAIACDGRTQGGHVR